MRTTATTTASLAGSPPADDVSAHNVTLPRVIRSEWIKLRSVRSTIVTLVLRLGREDDASLWLAEARERFPRLRRPPELIQLDDPLPSLITGEIEHADVGQTVRRYLSGELAGDPDRDELIALAAELLDARARERA